LSGDEPRPPVDNAPWRATGLLHALLVRLRLRTLGPVILTGPQMRTLDLDQYWPDANASKKSARPEGGAANTAGDQSGDVGVTAIELSGVLPQSSAAGPDRRTPVIWGGLGFLAGMLAWHVIGFWSFVSDVAFNDDARTAAGSSGRAQRSATVVRHNPSTRGDNPSNRNCVALAIDRTSGDAKPGACPVHEEPLADAGRIRREDLAFSKPRLQDPQIWVNATAVEPEVAADAIDESAFDLTIRPGP
jgi:hypothetical protein